MNRVRSIQETTELLRNLKSATGSSRALRVFHSTQSSAAGATVSSIAQLGIGVINNHQTTSIQLTAVL